MHFQGTYQTYTCWTPVGDCPRELGGLALLPGSHKIDAVHDHHFSLGAGSLAIDTEQLEGQWVTTDYGDRRYLDLPQPDGASGAPEPDGRPAADLAG